jgi:hypothetical protein
MNSNPGKILWIALTAAAMTAALSACQRKPISGGAVSSVVAGRQIIASIAGPGFIRLEAEDSTNKQESETATITFPGHKVRVEKERLLVDDQESAKIAPTTRRIDVLVSNATITVLADSTNIFATQVMR